MDPKALDLLEQAVKLLEEQTGAWAPAEEASYHRSPDHTLSEMQEEERFRA